MFVFQFDLWTLIGFLVQVGLPLGVAWLATTSTPKSVQWTLTATVTALISLLTQAVAAHSSGQPFDLFQAGLTALAGLLISISSHFGWTASGIAGKAANARVKPAPIVTTTPTQISDGGSK